MKTQKLWGIICIIVGAAMFFFSGYIAEQVAQGKMEIQQGKRSVRAVDSAFSQSQYTKPFGDVFTGGAKKKIAAGEREVSKYESISQNLRIGGIVIFVIGVFLLIFNKKHK